MQQSHCILQGVALNLACMESGRWQSMLHHAEYHAYMWQLQQHASLLHTAQADMVCHEAGSTPPLLR